MKFAPDRKKSEATKRHDWTDCKASNGHQGGDSQANARLLLMGNYKQPHWKLKKKVDLTVALYRYSLKEV